MSHGHPGVTGTLDAWPLLSYGRDVMARLSESWAVLSHGRDMMGSPESRYGLPRTLLSDREACVKAGRMVLSQGKTIVVNHGESWSIVIALNWQCACNCYS